MDLSKEVLIDMHRRMVRIRLFEEAAGRLAEAAKLPGFLHLYVGEEAVAAGVCASAERRRPDHLDPSRSRPPRRQGRRLQADDGRADGQVDRLLQGQGRVDAHLRPRARHARRQRHRRCRFADRRRRGVRQQVPQARSASPSPFFGDGATNIGAFHEAANMACALHLPIVFVCENNEYGEFTPREQDDGDHRHRRPCRRLRHAGRHRRRHGRRRRPRGGGRGRRAGPARRRTVADRGQDVPVLQPPRRPEPRAQVPHRRRGRGVEGARSDLLVRGAADRGRRGDGRRDRARSGPSCAPTSTTAIAVRRGQPAARARPAAGRRLHDASDETERDDDATAS